MKTTTYPKFELLPVASLHEAGWNYKVANSFLQEKLAANIKRNGQLETIIVREVDNGYEVVNGNHRLLAFRSLGTEEVMACNIGRISDAAARRIAIETNETSFERNDLQFSERLNEILQEFPEEELMQTMPFTKEEFTDLLSVHAYNWDDARDGARKDKPKKNEVKISLTPEQLEIYERAKKKTGSKEDVLLIMQAIAALLASIE